MTASVMQIKKY